MAETTDVSGPSEGQLTAREREVVALIASGLSSRQVATKLDIAFKTVIVHRYNAMQKMKVNNVVGLMWAAIQMGLVEPPKRGVKGSD